MPACRFSRTARKPTGTDSHLARISAPKILRPGINAGKPARCLVEGGHLRLSPGCDINKDRNENQERIAKEAEKAERKCQDLSQGGRDLRRSGVPEFHCEEGMENPTAIHWKSGDHIEKNQENVDGGEPCKKQDAWIVNPCQIVGLDRSDDEEEKKGDDDVHHRSRDRDRKFLRRFLRHARHARHAPNGQQNHIWRLDPEAPGHENVAEFVENDAGENENNEKHAVTRRRRPALLPGAGAEYGERSQGTAGGPFS